MKNKKNKVNFEALGMHCKSCELLIKDELANISGVEIVSVDHKTGKGYLVSKNEIDEALILKAISDAGYRGVIENGDERVGKL